MSAGTNIEVTGRMTDASVAHLKCELRQAPDGSYSGALRLQSSELPTPLHNYVADGKVDRIKFISETQKTVIDAHTADGHKIYLSLWRETKRFSFLVTDGAGNAVWKSSPEILDTEEGVGHFRWEAGGEYPKPATSSVS